MAYNKRRYRRVSTHSVIDRAWWSGTKVTMFSDGTWWINTVGGQQGFERPRFIALDGVRIDLFKDATPAQRQYGIVTMRSFPSLCPLDYGEKSGRPYERRSFENRFKPVTGGLHVPA